MRSFRLWIVSGLAALCGVPIKVREDFFQARADEPRVAGGSSST
jgi:hypothetical protein